MLQVIRLKNFADLTNVNSSFIFTWTDTSRRWGVWTGGHSCGDMTVFGGVALPLGERKSWKPKWSMTTEGPSLGINSEAIVSPFTRLSSLILAALRTLQVNRDDGLEGDFRTVALAWVLPLHLRFDCALPQNDNLQPGASPCCLKSSLSCFNTCK